MPTGAGAVREQVDRAFDTLLSNPPLFERIYPRARYVPTWSQWLPASRSDRTTYERLALMLAYSGIDSTRNVDIVVGRDIRPKDWEEARLAQDGLGIHDSKLFRDGMNLLPQALLLLYSKSGEERTLGFLLDLHTDGHMAEGQDEAVEQLWNADPAPVLRCASGSVRRQNRLVSILRATDYRNRPEIPGAVRTLGVLSRHADPRVSQTARRLAASLNGPPPRR